MRFKEWLLQEAVIKPTGTINQYGPKNIDALLRPGGRRFMVNYTGDQEAIKKTNQEVIHLLQTAQAYLDPLRGGPNGVQTARDNIEKAYQMLKRTPKPPSMQQQFEPADMLLQLTNVMAQDTKQDYRPAIAAVLAQLSAPGV